MTKKYGIIGNPIKHSLSPTLHNYWFEKYKIDANYSIIEIETNELPNLINRIKDKLKKLTNDALKKGIFGAPTYYVNRKIFFGQDRLNYAIDEIKK